jgi:hypothetical protein
MAIKAFTRKTSGPTTSDEFLKDYENLLKRNKGGGTFMGYDTSSQTPIYLGTSVADPTGIGGIDQTNLDNSVTDDYSTIDPSFVDISTLTPDELLQFYTNPQLDENTKLIIEQLVPELSDTTQINQNTDNLNQATNQYEKINQGITDINEQYTPNSETNLLKRNYSRSVNPTQQRYTGDAAITDEQIAQLPAEYQDIMRIIRDNARFLQDAPQEIEAIRKANEEQRQKENAVKGTVTNDINQAYSKMTGQTPDQMQKNLENSKQAETWNDIPEGFEMNAEGTGIVRKKESNDMGSAINELLSFIGNKAGEGIKNVRGAVGDTIDSLAYAIPGTSNRKDTGFSEWVAGRDTPHTVSAAEPETAQAGSGLTRLRDDMSYSPTALAGRPDFSQIGLKRSIGNVAGIQDQSAITGNKQVSPDGQSISNVSRFSQATAPTSTTLPQFNVQESRPSRTFDQSQLGSIVDAMMSKGYSNRAEAEAVARADINRFGNEYLPSGGSSNNVGVGSNQPQTQQSGQQSSNNTSRANTYTAPTTSNNAMTYSNLSNIGTPNFVMPTVGVGSNQPSTSSSSSNSNSLMSTISNILSNLFRRK